MKNYSNWMTKSNSSEEITFDMAEKSTVKVNGSLTLNEVITNDANEWQKDVDIIWLVKKSHYVPSFGDYIEFSGNHYLSIFPPEERETFWSSKARLCNSLFPIQSDKTQVLIGNDPKTGRPVYEEMEGNIVYEPCIAETKYPANNATEQLPLPKGDIYITMKYRTDESLKVNYEFTMYGNQYKVTDFDLTKVIGDKGIMRIIAERMV